MHNSLHVRSAKCVSSITTILCTFTIYGIIFLKSIIFYTINVKWKLTQSVWKSHFSFMVCTDIHDLRSQEPCKRLSQMGWQVLSPSIGMVENSDGFLNAPCLSVIFPVKDLYILHGDLMACSSIKVQVLWHLDYVESQCQIVLVDFRNWLYLQS